MEASVNLRVKGYLPDGSYQRLTEAMADTHCSGLLNHCVEVLVWKRMALAFAVGLTAGALVTWLIH